MSVNKWSADTQTLTTLAGIDREAISELSEEISQQSDDIAKLQNAFGKDGLTTITNNSGEVVSFINKAKVINTTSLVSDANSVNSKEYTKLGGTSLKVTKSNSAKSQVVFVDFGKEIDIEESSDTTYGVWLYIPRETYINMNYISIRVGLLQGRGTTNAYMTNQVNMSIAKTSLVSGWNYVRLTIPYDESKHTFDCVMLRLADNTASSDTEHDELTVYFDSIVKDYNLKPTVLLCFDNSNDANLYDVIFDEMSKRGLYGTFAYQGGQSPDGNIKVDGILQSSGVTREHLNEMLAEGWDVAQYDGLHMTQDIDDIKAYNKLLKEQGLEMTAYLPRYNQITDDIWSEYKSMGFKIVRTANSMYYINSNDVEVLNSIGFTFTNTFSVLKDYIDNAIANNQAISILTHRVLETADSTTSNCLLSEFTQLLDYIQTKVASNEIQLMTYKEFYNAK